MKKFRSKLSCNAALSILGLSLLLSGCELGSLDEIRNPQWRHSLVLVQSLAVTYQLKEQIEFKFEPDANGSKDVMHGSSRYKLLPGEYFFYGTTDTGRFFKGRKSCVIRSGNLGQSEDGGVYIPNAPDSRIGIWLQAREENSAAITMFGAAGYGMGNPNAMSTAFLLAWIPDEPGRKLRADFDQIK